MNVEELYYSRLKKCLERSPSNIFKGKEFVSFGGVGNEGIVQDLVEIHGGVFSKVVNETSTHFILPLYSNVSTNGVRDAIVKKQLILVPLFWIVDCVINLKLLPVEGENSEYNYDHEERLKVAKRKREHHLFGPPTKKRLNQDGEMLFIFPTVNVDEEGEEEPTLLTPNQKITFQLTKPPEVDPRMSKGKHVYFDGRNKKYFSVMLHLPEEENHQNLVISQRKYFVMQIVRGFARGEITLFFRWGRAGETCYSHQVKFSRIMDADLEFQEKYKQLTNNDWNVPVDQFKYSKGLYIPVNFDYKFNLPKATVIWADK